MVSGGEICVKTGGASLEEAAEAAAHWIMPDVILSTSEQKLFKAVLQHIFS